MSQQTVAGLEENFRFMIMEVRRHVVRTQGLLERPESVYEPVVSRDEYVDNLRTVIHAKCFALVGEVEDKWELGRLEAIDRIATELERIADFCESILDQIGYVEPLALLRERDYSSYFDEILGGIDLIEAAMEDREVKTALRICRAEDQVDQIYASAFAQSIEALESGGPASALVTMIFIDRYLERIGDSLLNIGESIISSLLGERIKIGSFRALDSTTEDSIEEGEVLPALEAVGETKSGHRIRRVKRSGTTRDDKPVIFKEGRRKKLVEERDAIEEWKGFAPELVPSIYAFHDHDEHASILFEFLPGHTFEETLLRGSEAALERALGRITETLDGLWKRTRIDDVVAARFSDQILKRLPDVFALHPEFRQSAQQIGNRASLAFEDLVHEARKIESRLSAPFSVRIHGDFNIDNVILDEERDRLHFIDLHRSRQTDFVQDVSVFLVSCYRLQVFDAPVRARIGHVTDVFQDFAARWAEQAGDSSYGRRLMLALARSFATSTRFVLDKDFARSMFLRARYLLERFVALGEEGGAEGTRSAHTRIPEEIFHD